MTWTLLAPQITAALEAADLDTQPLLEAQLFALFEPWTAQRIHAREFYRRLTVTAAIHAERDPAYRAEQREATAYHEAGHAVTAHVLGGWVHSVTIVPTADDLAFGHVRYQPPRGASPDDDGVITLAGPLAQALGGYLGGMEEHRQQCNASLLDGRPGLSCAARLALLRFLEIRAHEIVTTQWPAISRVVRALLLTDTLTRPAFLEALTPPVPVREDAAA